MSNNAADRTDNSLMDWALMIPTVVVGAVGAVAYGAACMVMWAAKTALGRGKGV